ncbi:MAG: hypothetical protein L6Q54_14170 [Leptospiraceae bacterium]|nr:hypothetical protein [Leptospiraceae bacterium]MCK6382381.1 hypothetical protein [Leptospiraceae bacterium]NUM41178.1 hypothetical protein [Leptospiraceae bacterium]
MRSILLEPIFKSIYQYLSLFDYRIKSSLISFSLKLTSGFISIIIYLMIKKKIPSDITYPDEISLLVTIVISIIGIFPVQEYLYSYFRNLFLSEYLTDDSLSAKIAYRRFDADSLIKNVFPVMVKMSSSPSGVLAVLNKSETQYDIYSYSSGRQRKVKIRGENFNTRLTNLLRSKKQSISVADVMKFPELNEDFTTLKSSFIIPFIFREKLFGFLATTNIPSEEVKADLSFLSSKAALAVHNHILSFKVAENKKYKREFETAERIQFSIQSTKVPVIPDLEIQLLEKDQRLLSEFYTIKENGIVFVIFALPSNRKGEGLVLAYIAGALYIQLRQFNNNLNEIKKAIENTLAEIYYTDHYEFLIGYIENDKNILQVLASGHSLTATKSDMPEKNIISLGWKNLIDLDSNSILFKLQDKNILLVRKK